LNTSCWIAGDNSDDTVDRYKPTTSPKMISGFEDRERRFEGIFSLNLKMLIHGACNCQLFIPVHVNVL
jgi:hypothetical protein